MTRKRGLARPPIERPLPPAWEGRLAAAEDAEYDAEVRADLKALMEAPYRVGPAFGQPSGEAKARPMLGHTVVHEPDPAWLQEQKRKAELARVITAKHPALLEEMAALMRPKRGRPMSHEGRVILAYDLWKFPGSGWLEASNAEFLDALHRAAVPFPSIDVEKFGEMRHDIRERFAAILPANYKDTAVHPRSFAEVPTISFPDMDAVGLVVTMAALGPRKGKRELRKYVAKYAGTPTGMSPATARAARAEEAREARRQSRGLRKSTPHDPDGAPDPDDEGSTE
jgi:hypothetical protein